MTKYVVYITAIVLLIQLSSCLDRASIESISSSKPASSDNLGIEINGEVVYWFYQKYGFTDIEEQLIVITKLDSSDIPKSAIDLGSSQTAKINLNKFNSGPFHLRYEKNIHRDILLEGKEYSTHQDISVFQNEDRFSIVLSDSTETIYLFDSKNHLLYTEIIKWDEKETRY